MRLESLLVAMLVLSHISSPATAESRESSAFPRFSTAENRTVERNELLSALKEYDPRLVRQILDAIAQRHARNSEEFVARALDGIDRFKNPDIVSSTRTADASIEWIDLLRRARAEKEEIQRRPKAEPDDRTAAGSVETIKMLMDAKKVKGTAK
jgi:hypothetical protein